MATPLPSNAFSGQPHQAYQKCIDLESLALTNPTLQSSSPPGLVAARLLGYLLVHSENGRPKLAREIINASDDAALISLAQHYINHFVIVFKRTSGRTPAPSEHPSRPSLEAEREALASISDPASLDHRKAKQATLTRDGYRCPVTGLYDEKAVESGLVELPEGAHEGYTEAAHIIPESTNHGIDKRAKAHQSVGVWAVLSMFSSTPELLHDRLNGNQIHRLENIITLEMTVHAAFDMLRIWFKPVPDCHNTYDIHTRTGTRWLSGRPLPETVTLTTTDERFPVPSRHYLELHALCCEVTNLSGAAEYVDLVQDNLEELNVLARDGSSAELLSFALSRVTMY